MSILGIGSSKSFIGPIQLVGSSTITCSVATVTNGVWITDDPIYLTLEENDIKLTIQAKIKAKVILNSGNPDLNVVFL